MVQPQFQNPDYLARETMQNTLKRLGQSQVIKVGKTGKNPFINPLKSEKHVPTRCESEPPDLDMGWIQIDQQIMACGPASNLTQVLLDPPVQKGKDKVPRPQRAKTGQPQTPQCITFSFRETAEAPRKQPAL